ncbi:hypothetical protein W97_02979 [Coniosporium apollinis CBS 100218]|uniref:Uncharacterized protein n=1 Tax=Coniosporium apollinis (strain CBS 100218) TaxID=1168221 RepID=R7YQ18_CONA1|nr:uncharacterized protein W97_02979 [Coniosporium apollinis CBS 100218]EON63751.1 hypothetical protein W97_02979 [Coniosporium apollinis CBS 100218]
MIARGSKVEKFEDTRDSTLDIIIKLPDGNQSFCRSRKSSLTRTRISAKLQEIQRQLEEASAKYDSELQGVLALQKEELERLRDDSRRAQDELRYQNRNAHRDAEIRIKDLKQLLVRQMQEAELSVKAQRIENRREFEQIVAKLMEDEGRIRTEKRRFMEQTIVDLQEKKKKTPRGAKAWVEHCL